MSKVQLGKALSGGVLLRIFSMIAGVLVSVLLARSLGPSDFGVYSLVIAIASVMAVPAQFGLSQLSIKEVSKYVSQKDKGSSRQFVQWAYGENLKVSSLLISIFIGVGFSVCDKEFYWIIFLSAIAIYIMSVNQIRAGIMQGFGKVIAAQIPDLAVRPLLMLCFIIVFLNHLELEFAVFLYVVALFVSAFLGGVLASRYFSKFTGREDTGFDGKGLYQVIIPLGLVSAIQLLNSNVDILMVGWLASDASVGVYKIAVQFGAVVLFGERAVQIALMPVIAAKVKEIAVIRNVTKKSSRLASLFSFVLFVIFAVYGEWIITVFIGSQYQQSHDVLVVLALCYFLSFLIGPGATILTMMGFEKDALKGVIVSLSINVFLNILLVTYWGVIGAAASTFFALLCSRVYMAYIVKKKLGIWSGVWG